MTKVLLRIFSKNYIFLSLSVVALVITLAIALMLHADTSEDDRRAYVKKVEATVNKQLSTVYQQSAILVEKYAQLGRPTFSELKIPSTFPYYVFENGNLAYWSDYRFVPHYEQLYGEYDHKLLISRSGKFLVYRQALEVRGRFVEIFSLIPIVKRFQVDNLYVHSGLNESIFFQEQVWVSPMISYDNPNVVAENGDFLFSIEYPTNFRLKKESIHKAFVLSGLLTLILLTCFVFSWAHEALRQEKYGKGLFIIIGYLFLIRALLLAFNLPYSVYSLDLFSSRYYASSIISPSIGDLLLNVLVVAVAVAYIFNYFFKTRLYTKVKQSQKLGRHVLAILVVVISYIGLYIVFNVLRTIYFNSQWTLDITSSINFSSFKIVSLLIFVIVTFIYFLSTHILLLLFKVLTVRNRNMGVILFAIGTLIYLLLSFIPGTYFREVLPLHSFYFFTVYAFNYTRYLDKFKYHTYIYLFLSAVICAGVGTYALQDFNRQDAVANKQKFGTQLLAENDLVGEYLLSEAIQRIKGDDFIKKRLMNLFASKELIEQKIKRSHLGSYFDNYDIQVIVFNAYGDIYTDIGEEIDYYSLRRIFAKERYQTEFQDIYFLSELDKNIFKEYFTFIDMEYNGTLIGHIVINLKLKRVIPDNVYPELLVDKKFILPYYNRNYSYAIYSANELRYSSGSYNYDKNFHTPLFERSELYEEGIERGGKHHLALRGTGNKTIVVTSDVYPLKNVFTNFSFLFLILILCVFITIIVYSLYLGLFYSRLNFATKIQVYLNIAFFLPLFSVSVIITSAISRGYKEDLNNSFTRRSENISANIVNMVDRYKRNIISHETLNEALLQVAQFTETDINVFDRSGNLIISTQPLIYEKDLLSTYVNPVARIALMEEKEKTVLLSESVEDLHYSSVYVGLTSNDTGRLIGILSIPFFESKYELDRQIIDVLSTIINIFTAIFILFLVLSYFASQLLIDPLRMITQKIKKTTLERNEPIDWQTSDEIGLLVGEYNRMIAKLEASREALSRSEKESAWREMAQQVAHEIKNPLTPMKLTLQHLQRTIGLGDAEKLEEHTDRAVSTLLVQVDNLNDIATSFSAFAKMPVPRNETLEIVSLVKETVNLYHNDSSANVALELPQHESYVLGDAQLMSRIITNLMLNAIQSVPQSRTPEIKVIVSHNASKSSVLIEVRDNGTGIPEAIHDKIFVPNFSTKYAGSGIGLAMAKRGIEHAGGRIWFETTEEVGTSFFIELPVLNVS
jgi:two-component system, NtrC family, nitrogen regulation sensor histidine kinase NtrY